MAEALGVRVRGDEPGNAGADGIDLLAAGAGEAALQNLSAVGRADIEAELPLAAGADDESRDRPRRFEFDAAADHSHDGGDR